MLSKPVRSIPLSITQKTITDIKLNIQHFLMISLTLLLTSCTEQQAKNVRALEGKPTVTANDSTNPYPSVAAIPLPPGFERIKAENISFATWLRQIKLKADKTVFLYNGSAKKNQLAQFAVLDISTGNQDLQQCADAVMRLRAEYLYSRGDYDSISFKDNDGRKYQLSQPFTRDHFDRFLLRVFGMCGSASLSKQLFPVSNLSAIKPGNVLIRGGFPGHAVIVVDVAQNANGKKIFIIAQSYMPAQDIHILVNPINKELSPWYEVKPEDNHIMTPEYLFYKNELKRW